MVRACAEMLGYFIDRDTFSIFFTLFADQITFGFYLLLRNYSEFNLFASLT